MGALIEQLACPGCARINLVSCNLEQPPQHPRRAKNNATHCSSKHGSLTANSRLQPKANTTLVSAAKQKNSKTIIAQDTPVRLRKAQGSRGSADRQSSLQTKDPISRRTRSKKNFKRIHIKKVLLPEPVRRKRRVRSLPDLVICDEVLDAICLLDPDNTTDLQPRCLDESPAVPTANQPALDLEPRSPTPEIASKVSENAVSDFTPLNDMDEDDVVERAFDKLMANIRAPEQPSISPTLCNPVLRAPPRLPSQLSRAVPPAAGLSTASQLPDKLQRTESSVNIDLEFYNKFMATMEIGMSLKHLNQMSRLDAAERERGERKLRARHHPDRHSGNPLALEVSQAIGGAIELHKRTKHQLQARPMFPWVIGN